MSFVQGTGVSIDDRGVLLIGPPGSGKSDLALRVIARGGQLIGDDGVECGVENYALRMGAVADRPRRLHVAGIGFVNVPVGPSVPLALVVATHRPDGRTQHIDAFEVVAGWHCPRIALDPFEASAVDKLLLALDRWGH